MDKKFSITRHDYKDIKNPISRSAPIVRLYRIIAIRDFEIPYVGIIREGTLGGYVESESNLSQESSAWIMNTAKAFGNAIVKGNAILKDDAAIYGDAVVDGHSVLQNYARVYGNAKLSGRCIISDRCDVKGNTELTDVIMNNASMIFENAKVNNCKLRDGAMVRGNSVVIDTNLMDISEIDGNSIIENCELKGRSVLRDKECKNETFNEEINLKVTTGK